MAAALEAERLQKLNELLRHTWEHNAFYRRKWKDVSVCRQPLTSVETLKQFPFTTRTELLNDQLQNPPLGTNLSFPADRYKRFHRSSGSTRAPIFWADDRQSWRWVVGCSRSLFEIAGVKTSDRVFLALAFGASSGPWIMYEGAQTLGCCCFATGTSDPAEQLQWIQRFKPSVLVASTTHLQRLSDEADRSSLRVRDFGISKIIAAGSPSIEVASLRSRIEEQWQATTLDRYGCTEAGSVASACPFSQGAMHLLDTDFIAELVQSNGAQPASVGTQGEIVLTNLGRIGRPIIRYRTGDSAKLGWLDCACGRSGPVLLGGVSRINAR